MSMKKDCYELLKKIPCGKVSTYKELANALNTKSYRYMGKILSENQELIKIPCHRIVKSNSELGGYAEGIQKKKELLKKEGLEIKKGKILNFDKAFFKF